MGLAMVPSNGYPLRHQLAQVCSMAQQPGKKIKRIVPNQLKKITFDFGILDVSWANLEPYLNTAT